VTGRTAPLAQIVEEARRLTSAAVEQNIPVRLLGGLAVRASVSGAFHTSLSREYKDIDFVTLKDRGKVVTGFLEEMGYEPDRQFNAFGGGTRLLFHDPSHGRQLDVFVGAFRMCHAIPLGARLSLDPVTVPLAELLLTKLQVVSLNEKDLRDIVAILYHHEVADRDGHTINAQRVAELCAQDWGLWRTCKMNFERVHGGLEPYNLAADERATVQQRLDRLWARIDAEPKTRGWRLRDRIGDRKRWYEEPDEVEP